MKLLQSIILVGLLNGVAMAKVGDTCVYKGLTGSCQPTSKCRSNVLGAPGYFYASGACPNDGSSIKCCLQAACYAKEIANDAFPDGYGWCQNTAVPCQGGGPFARYLSNKCPGLPDDVKCCVVV